jgi:DNA-binding transcriptional ArsR family regulator
MMNETKMKILELVKQPTTIKDLQEKSGLKWANLSLHLKDLEDEGYIIVLGKKGKSKVVQMNQHNVEQYFTKQYKQIDQMRDNLIQR